MQDYTSAAPNRAEPYQGIESPTPRPMHIRFGENGLLVPAWSPESAGLGGQLARATYAATSEPSQISGLTPMGYQAIRNANPDLQQDWWIPGFIENWWAGWNGEAMPATSFAPNVAFQGEDGAQPYLDARFKDSPESWEFYSEEQKRALKNSNSTEDVEFKLRYFGQQNAALDRIKFHDSHSGGLSYVTNKTLSAAVNYVGADPVTNVATLGTAGATLKGVSALSKAGKTIQTMSAVAAGSVEGGAMGALYEYNQTKFQNQLGNDLDTFDGQTVAWGVGLGAFAGLIAGATAPGLSNKLIQDLSDEIAGMPLSKAIAAGVEDVQSMAARLGQEGALGERAARRIKAVGARVDSQDWIFGTKLKYTTFASANEAVEWLETAKPSSAELDQLSEAIAVQVVNEMEGKAVGKIKLTNMKTEFQKTNKEPKFATQRRSDDETINRLSNEYNVSRSAGILQNIPGASRIAGSIIKGLGGFGARGKGVLANSLGGVAYAFQMLNPVGTRNGDMSVVRTAVPSLQAARASASNNLRKKTGLQKDLLRYNKDIKAAATNGVDVMSEIATVVLTNAKSSHEWANVIAAKFKQTLDDYGNRAAAAGLIDKAEDYFPVLFDKGAIARGGVEFQEAFTKYLTKKFTQESSELNRITVVKLKKAGTWSKDTDSKITKYGQLEGKMKVQYDKALAESLSDQAKASTLRLQGQSIESLLINPNALEEGAIVQKSMNADPTMNKTLPSDIYLDDGMKPFLTQNLPDVLRYSETNLFARTEFALGQAQVFGRAMEYPEMLAMLKNKMTREMQGVDEIGLKERKELEKLFEQAERTYDAEMGRLPADRTAFNTGVAEDVVATGMNMIRAGSAGFWGIAAATMELPIALMQGSGYNPRELGDRLGDALRSVFNTEYRWDNLAATADALDELRVNLRGMLENSSHEGTYLGMSVGERISSPWINVRTTLANQDVQGFEKFTSFLNAGSRMFADYALQAGMMPAITRTGRIMVGRASERFVSRKLGAMRKLSEMMANGVDDPKAFKAMARKAGFRTAQDASDINGSGLMDPKVMSFLEDLQSAGLLGRKGWDNARIYEYAQKKGKLADYNRFVNAQTEYITNKMNYAFANPNATSRVDVASGNWAGQMFSMFMNFPAAFYQQRMLKQTQGDTVGNGPGLFAAYVGLEVLHRSLRDMATPGGDEFLSPNAVLEDWQEKTGHRVWRSISGGLPLTGLYPLGQMAESFVTGRPISGNLTTAGLSKLFQHIRSTGEHAQRGLEYMELLNQSRAQ